MPDDTPTAVIDTSTLPIMAGSEAQGDSPQELMARFDALAEAGKTAASEAPKKAEVAQETTPKTEAEAPKVEEGEPATPPAKAKWGELRKKADEYDKVVAEKEQRDKELEETRQQLEAIRKDDPTVYKKQLEEKEKAIADYEQRLALADVRASKEYAEAVLKPFESIGQSVREIAGAYEMDPQVIQQALLNPDPVAQRKALNELLADFSEADRSEILAHAREVRSLSAKAAELESKAAEAKKELEFRRHQEAEEAKKADEARMKQAGDKVWETMAEKLPLLKDEKVAEQVRKATLDPKDPAMKAYNAYAGMVVPILVTKNNELAAKVVELQATLDARNAARPGAGTSTVTTTDSPATGLPEGETVIDRFGAWQRQNAA